MEAYVMPGPHHRDTRHGSLLGADLFHMDLGTVSVFTCADPQGLFQSPSSDRNPVERRGNVCRRPNKVQSRQNQYGAMDRPANRAAGFTNPWTRRNTHSTHSVRDDIRQS